MMTFAVFLLTRCMDGEKAASAPLTKTSFSDFAGSASCISCHKDIYDQHIRTAHFNSSSPASASSIKGSFAEGSNSFFFNPHVKMLMEKRDSGFYQVEYFDNQERKARRFDVTVGSATRGQTYLYWWGDTLFQLPITYFTALQEWTNSPGYANRVTFGRPVTARCLECHTTFVQTLSAPGVAVDEFDKHKIIYGIDCEKCHGPAAGHVQYHTAHPEEKTARFIVNPADFSRRQSLDLCALCHGGRLQKTAASFSFQPGDSLGDFFATAQQNRNVAGMDVHGNQFGLLQASKCFTLSQMTCLTCHDAHANEKGQLAVYSQRCIGCHNEKDQHECKLKNKIGPAITQNCIDCHMPEQASGAIVVLREGASIPTAANMRTHYIRVYPELTKTVLDTIRKMAVLN